MAALASAAAPAVAAADEPEITRAPALTGSALVGARLDAVGARWRGWPTPTASWGWLRCDTDSLWSCDVDRRALASTLLHVDARPTSASACARCVCVSNRDGRDWDWSDGERAGGGAAATRAGADAHAATPVAAAVAAPPPPAS